MPNATKESEAVRVRFAGLFSFESRNPTSRRSKVQKVLHCSKPLHSTPLSVVARRYRVSTPKAIPVRFPSCSALTHYPTHLPSRPLPQSCIADATMRGFEPPGALKTPSCNLFGRVVGYTRNKATTSTIGLYGIFANDHSRIRLNVNNE